MISKHPKCDDLSALLVIARYISYKSRSQITCEDCKQLFEDKDKPFNLDISYKHLDFLEFLNRGRLTYPSDILFTVLQCCYTIFNMCIADPIESSFHEVYNHKYTLIGTIE